MLFIYNLRRQVLILVSRMRMEAQEKSSDLPRVTRPLGGSTEARRAVYLKLSWALKALFTDTLQRYHLLGVGSLLR